MASNAKSKQSFMSSYKKTFPFIKECTSKGKDSCFYARCIYCEADIYIGASGSRDIKRHQSSLKHSNKEKMRMDTKSARVDQFMIRRNDMDEAAKKENALSNATTRAELILVNLIAELNLSLNSADTLSLAFKKMFPDSEIAAKFSCGRTKATAIIKDMAKKHKEGLLARMKDGAFSLATDGSNDSNSKLYPLVVCTVDPDTLTVRSEVVSLPVLQNSATGENIFFLLDTLLKEGEIPWSNCVSFGCDNASVMTGIHKGVFAFIKKKNPNCFLSGCTLHLVHLAAEKAADKLPRSPSDLLIDILYYLKKSSARQANLAKHQDFCGQEQRTALKHVNTRWLSIGRCLKRLVEDWVPLHAFFLEEKTLNTKNGSSAHAKASSIYEQLNSHTTRLYTLFLKYAVKIFEPFLTLNQSESPQIHSLQYSMNRLMKDILMKFVKPSGLANKLPFEVEFNLSYNLKDFKDIVIGSEAELFIKKKNISGTKLEQFQKSVQQYYIDVCTYLRDNLPHSNVFLKNIASVDPTKFCEDNALRDLKSMMALHPCLIPKGSNADQVVEDLTRLQILVLESDSETKSTEVEKVWAQMAQNKDVEMGCRFLLNLLVTPHSSASCERVFSCVRKIKTDQRSLMGDTLLEALIICKHIAGTAVDRNYTTKQIKFFKGSCSRALTSH